MEYSVIRLTYINNRYQTDQALLLITKKKAILVVIYLKWKCLSFEHIIIRLYRLESL